MVETFIRHVLAHPKRVWIVIALTLGIGLLFTWPAVDSYSAAKDHRAKLESELQEGEALAGKVELYQKQAEKKLALLRELEAKALPPAEIEALRNQLVAMVKDSHCKLRRVRLGDASLRTWFDEDNPLEMRARPDSDKKSPFRLKTQPLNLAVTGNLTDVSDFLTRLSQQERLIHTGGFQLRRSDTDKNLVELEIDLLLFDLAPMEAKKT
ncbi:MAG: hypothetical protein IAF94_16195 [Pirellulaceae bacterium]|nr:hypothetical protein [Pirellulaceae bacterium]